MSRVTEQVIAEAGSNRRRTFALASFVGLQMARAWDTGALESQTTERALAFAQYAAAGIALGSMNRQSKLQGWSSWSSDLKPNPAAYAGSTAAGAPLGALLGRYGPAYRALVGRGLSTNEAAARIRQQVQRDTSNEVEQANYNALYTGTLGARSVKGYKRILIGATNCSRCVVLAGGRYYTEGFQRHPQCDCQHVPVSAAVDASTDFNDSAQANGRRYYENLTPEGRLYVAGNSKAKRDALDAAAKEGGTAFNKELNKGRWRPDRKKAGTPGKPNIADEGVDASGLYTMDMATVARSGRAGRPTVKSTVMRDADDTASARALLEERGFITVEPQLDMPTRQQIAGSSRAL